MKRYLSLALTFFLMLNMLSCNSTKKTAMQELVLLSTNEYSEIKDKEFLVIKDDSELEAVYNRFLSIEETPKIDWTKYQVVLLALGKKNTGGYSILAESMSKTKSEIIVYYKSTGPKPGDMVTQAFTSAYALYQIENKDKLPISFQEVSGE